MELAGGSLVYEGHFFKKSQGKSTSTCLTLPKSKENTLVNAAANPGISYQTFECSTSKISLRLVRPNSVYA